MDILEARTDVVAQPDPDRSEFLQLVSGSFCDVLDDYLHVVNTLFLQLQHTQTEQLFQVCWYLRRLH